MNTVVNSAVIFVAALHVLFLILEMFLWKHPFGRRIFGTNKEYAESSAVLAANQGLYNGFLVAGLVWALLSTDNGFQLKLFFLGCVVLAGLFGGVTTSRSILWVQALPGALAMLLVLVFQS